MGYLCVCGSVCINAHKFTSILHVLLIQARGRLDACRWIAVGQCPVLCVQCVGTWDMSSLVCIPHLPERPEHTIIHTQNLNKLS